MKTKIYYFILLLMLVSCSDKDGGQEVIKIESNSVHVWPGCTNNYSIESDGIVSVTSLEPTIAQAKVENKILIVTATGIGKTTLILKNGYINDLKISVSTLLNGLYTEEHNFEGYAPKINVTAGDKEVIESIIRELTLEMSKFDNANYSFEWDGRFFLGLQSALNTPYEGTFNWDGKALELNYAGKSETYSFQGISNGPRPYMFSITTELTDIYQKMYSSSGIENVSITRYLSAVPPFLTEDPMVN